MADEHTHTVSMESIQWHTYNGKEYPVGATYDLPADLVDSLIAQGKAIRVDRVAHAAHQQAAADEAARHRAEGTTAVESMTTEAHHHHDPHEG